MNEPNPKISVITVVYNGAQEIEKTILSVIKQNYIDVEYIIIDGGSTDGTTDVIKKYHDKINYWVSEPDHGIYDAMNKGIDHANGLFTIVVNCGDYLYDDRVFGDIFGSLDDAVTYDMIYGRSKIIDDYGNITDLYIKHPLNQLWKGPIFRHGALLVKTSLLKQHKYEISKELKIAADFDFIYKIFKKGYKFISVDVVIVAFKEDGISNNPYKHITDSIFILKRYGDWNLKTRYFYFKKYIKTVLSRSFVRKIAKLFRIFFQEYFLNYWINKIPFYTIRHFYYKSILGIQLGKGSSIHLNCFLYGRNIYIGQNSTINRSCFLDGRGRLTIGNKVSISPHVQLITEDHDYNSAKFLGRSRDINIEDYVWIGTKAIILPGVTIGEGAVICAGAVVTKDVKQYDVVAGIPAVVIKQRNNNLDYNPSWLPYFD